jgi:hypothetical protein
MRYLRCTSWDECGVQLIYRDLIDMAVHATENGLELFNVIEDAKTFAEEVKPSLKTLRTGDYLWFVAPLYFFFGWGIEGLLLYPRGFGRGVKLSLGCLMQLVVCITACCWLSRKMMDQAGFPPSKHRLKYCGWLVLYIAVLYATGAFCTRIAGALVELRLAILPYALFSLLLGAGLYGLTILEIWRRLTLERTYLNPPYDVRLLGRGNRAHP